MTTWTPAHFVQKTVIGNGVDWMIKFINDIIDFWKETWVESKLMFFLESIGAITSVIAASILALSQVPNLIMVFIFYLIGSSCLLRVCYMRHASWLMLMFIFFTVMNVMGLANHF